MCAPPPARIIAISSEICLASLRRKPALQRKLNPHGAAHNARKADVLFFRRGTAARKYEFDIPFSRQQLADYLAVERSGLSLELGKMRDEGLLDFIKPFRFEGITPIKKQKLLFSRSFCLLFAYFIPFSTKRWSIAAISARVAVPFG